MPVEGGLQMKELTIAQIGEKLRAGELTARTITEMYLSQIEQLDKEGPALNSIIELNPEALKIADALDSELQHNGPRGPLHGVPILIKDNIDTADRMTTTAGSLALEGSIAPVDSFVAHRLRVAGAIILGKTNLSEWANFRSTNSTSGWSSRGGQTRNPYALDRNPCGSSSGSGVAVAANLCAAAIGTETDGSIICPSHVNGIVGIKPTIGLVSRSGIIPIAHSQDTAGPMARTVADAAALLGALTGQDPRDPATKASDGRRHADYTQFLDANGLQGTRIGVARHFFGFHAKVDHLMQTCVEEMARLGAEIIDLADADAAADLGESELEVLLYEFKTDLDAYLAGLRPDVAVHSLADVIEFNERHRERVMPYFGQERMLDAAEKGPLTDEAYRKALDRCRQITRDEGLDKALREKQLDAIVAPSGRPAWLTDLVNGDMGSHGSSAPAAVAGYPNITVPAGYIFGLPVGISFFSGAFQEPTLIKLAYAFEQVTNVRQPPRFVPTVDLQA
jgi:amidase